ncbi:autotransporter outer membrane beta-barrel domain-containing protein [Nautilia sp.]
MKFKLLKKLLIPLLAGNILNADIIIYDLNTTGVELNESNGVYITSSGAIDIYSDSNSAVYGVHIINASLDGNHSLINDGNITLSTSNGTSYGFYIDKDNNSSIINNGYMNLKDINTSSSTAIKTAGDNNGKIINNGTIISDYMGIVTQTNNNIITNNGNINNSAYAILILYNNEGNITNKGNITDTQYGITSFFKNKGIIINEGNITGFYKGISSAYSNNGTIENKGLLTSDVNSSVGIYNSLNYGYIINSGIINVYDDSKNTKGIEINTNTGIIINKGIINAGKQGININFSKGNVTNEGIINALYGIYFLEDSYTNYIENNGTINSDYAIYIESGSAYEHNTTIVNNSYINASDTVLYAADEVNGTFTNNGNINAGIYAKGFYIQNSGTVTLNSDQNITSKTFTQNSGAVLNITVKETPEGLESPTIKAQNIVIKNSFLNINAIDETGKNLSEWFDSLKDSNTTSGYKEFENGEGIIADANTTLDINVSAISVKDNSYLLIYALEKTDNRLNLIVTKKTSPFSDIIDNTKDTYAIGAAEALDEIFSKSSVSSEMGDFFTKFDTLSSTEEQKEIILSTAPLSGVSSIANTSSSIRTLSGIIDKRISYVKGMNSGNTLYREKNVWVKPFYSYTSQSNENGTNGFSAHSKGVVIGLDRTGEDSQNTGISLYVSDTELNTNDVNQSNDIDSFGLILYGLKPLNCSTDFIYQIGAGVQKNHSHRYIPVLNLSATAEYTSKLITLDATVKKMLTSNKKLNISSDFGFSYVYFYNPEYTETGAGALNLNVKSYHENSYILNAGGNLNCTPASDTFIYAKAAAHYNLNNTKQTVYSSYQADTGIVFKTDSIDSSRMTYTLSAGVKRLLTPNLYILIDCEKNLNNSGYKNTSVNAKLNWKFF